MDITRANYILGKAIAGFQEDEIEDLAASFEYVHDPDLEGLEEAKKSKSGMPMQCLECGHKFRKKIGPKTYEVKCPKCGSYDTDLG